MPNFQGPSIDEFRDFFSHCQRSERFVDICLVGRSAGHELKKIFAHSLVLGAVSPVIRDILRECPWMRMPYGLGSFDVLTIIFPDVDARDLQFLIETIYTNSFSIDGLTDSLSSLFNCLKIQVNSDVEMLERELSPTAFDLDVDYHEVDNDSKDEMKESDDDVLDLIEIDPNRLTSESSFVRIDSNLLKTLRTDEGIMFQCSDCEFMHKWNHTVVEHQQTVHKDGKSNQCQICGKGFAAKSVLKDHMTSHEEPETGAGKCDKCGMGFARRAEKLVHFRQNHKSDDPYVCYICQKQFPNTRRLKKHVYNHIKVPVLYCDICGKNFKFSHNLRIHKISAHSETKIWGCTKCDKTFKLETAMKTHVRVAHDKIFYIFCPNCGKGFKSKRNLEKHQRGFTCNGNVSRKKIPKYETS